MKATFIKKTIGINTRSARITTKQIEQINGLTFMRIRNRKFKRAS